MIAVIDPRMPCSAKAKLSEFCEVIELPPFSALDSRVASHPDMLIFELDGKLFTSKHYYNEAKKSIDKITSATSLTLVLTNDNIGNSYPNDIKFNTFLLNKSLIGNKAHISEEIRNYADTLGISARNVNQGYAKCSTVVLENAIITADKGIFSSAKELGAEALLVSDDGVLLEGYNCGFIGGASGVYENKAFFCGDILLHRDGKKIITFCENLGYKIICLSNDSLYDVGTILFLE